MLVIVCGLRLSDGTLGAAETDRAHALSLTSRLTDLALAVSQRGRRWDAPAEPLDIILLGDALDLIHSTAWLAADARPWHDPQSPAARETIARIVECIFHRHAPAIEAMRSLGASSAAPTRIHYMVGDRDWPLHLPGPFYSAVRACIAERLGLANRPDSPFPHDPGESDELLSLMRRHRLLARHGDIYDPLCFDEQRDSSSLADALAIELFAHLAIEVQRDFGEALPADFIEQFSSLGEGPLLSAADRIESALDEAAVSADARRIVCAAWNQSVDRFLQLDFVRTQKAWGPLDFIDGLSRTLRFGAQNSNRCSRFLAIGSQAARPREAMAEADFRRGRVDHIVYGHSPTAEPPAILLFHRNRAPATTPLPIHRAAG